MTRAGKFCLAGALFGWPAADGYQSPGQTAPDSWRAQFIKTAGGWALAGLFSSCRSGRDMVLEQAPKASLREDASFSTLLQAKKRLKTRSNVRNPTRFPLSAHKRSPSLQHGSNSRARACASAHACPSRARGRPAAV